jgi:hypothetical protein
MVAPGIFATKPRKALLAIVEFLTMMLAGGPPIESAATPSNALFALTLSLTVTLRVWVLPPTNSPSCPLFSMWTRSRTPFVVPEPVGSMMIP